MAAPHPHRADLLVLAQFAAAAGVLWPGGPRWPLPRPARSVAAVAALGGGGLALAGARELGRDLTPLVTPPEGARLRTSGVYRVSRNPVYAGLLALGWAVALLRRRPEPLAAAGVLSGVLHAKVLAEERRLRERFGAEYGDWAARTPRLLGLAGTRRPGRSAR